MEGIITAMSLHREMFVLLVAWAVAYTVSAAAATNAFAVAVGADVRVAGDNVFHYSPAGRGRSVKVAARPGWSFRGATDCRYNCLAWAVGRTDIWVNPVLKDSCENSIGDSMEFESNSVHYVGIDGKYGDGNGVCTQSEIDNFFLQEAGVEPTDSLSDATIIYYSNYHAARRRTCSCGRGHWIMFESKCGQGVKIEHVIDQLNGNTYGTPVRFYKPQ